MQKPSEMDRRDGVRDTVAKDYATAERILQLDGYTGYNHLTHPFRTNGAPITDAHFWAHAEGKLGSHGSGQLQAKIGDLLPWNLKLKAGETPPPLTHQQSSSDGRITIRRDAETAIRG